MKNILVFLLCSMMALGQTTPTSHIGLSKITPGGEINTWGPIINSNWDLVDSYLGGVLPLPILSFINGVTYVGDGSKFPGDIGAQLNAAITALPAPGGKIVIVPKADGTCYNFSTPVPLITLGKYVIVEYGGSNGFNGVSTAQGCLNFTPTSGSAFTIDYSTGTGIPSASAFGLRNILLINNNCVTNGGCGGSAIGIDSGVSNVGDSQAYYDNVSVVGFATGYRNLGTASHFGVLFQNPSFIHNGTAMLLASPSPIVIAYGTFAGNAKIFQTNDASSSPGIWGTFIDAFNNTTILDATASVSPNIGVFHCSFCHFEASTSAQTPFIQGAIDVVLQGGAAEIDIAGGTSASFFNLSGNYVNIHALQMLSSATVTNILTTSALLKGDFDGLVLGSNFGSPYVSGAGALNINTNIIGGGALPDNPTYFKTLTTPTFALTNGSGFICDESTAPAGISGKDVLYCDSTSHSWKVNYNNAGFFKVPQVIASGTSTLGAGSINATTCNSAVTTTATGALTTDAIQWAYASAPSLTTDAKLVLNPYVTSGNVNWALCNPTAGALVSTGLVVNWKVMR